MLGSSRGSSTLGFLAQDVRGLQLKLHTIVYTNKTCTITQLGARLKRDVLVDVLSQVCAFALLVCVIDTCVMLIN